MWLQFMYHFRSIGRNADGFPVGGRIDWVMANMGQSEQDACSTGKIVVLFYNSLYCHISCNLYPHSLSLF